MAQEKIQFLDIEQSALADEIKDFIEENPVCDLKNRPVQVNQNLTKIEELRNLYRRKHKELEVLVEGYDEQFAKIFESKLVDVKTYILELKNIQKSVKTKELEVEKVTEKSKKRSGEFLSGEIERSLKNLSSIFKVNIKDAPDHEISERKTDLPKIQERMENLSKMVQNLLDLSIDPSISNVEILLYDYRKLTDSKNNYCQSVEKEATERELLKKELFQESRLKSVNI